MHAVAECWWRHASSAHNKTSGLAATSGGKSSSGGGGAAGVTASSSLLASGGSSSGSGAVMLAAAGSPTAAAATAAAAADAAMCGLEAGTCFGLSAAACRTGEAVHCGAVHIVGRYTGSRRAPALGCQPQHAEQVRQYIGAVHGGEVNFCAQRAKQARQCVLQ